MAIWTLETDSGFTSFHFTVEGDQEFFEELVKDYFEESKPVSESWKVLYMLRGEPLKHPDFFSIGNTDVIAVSERAIDRFNFFSHPKIELLPIETDAGNYFALNVLNFVDCLDKSKSEYQSTKGGIIVHHKVLEFDWRRLADNKVFKIPEMPYQIFVDHDVPVLCKKENLNGLFFDSKVNLVWLAT